MRNTPSFDYLKSLGFTFQGARDWITADNRRQLAQDAALVTTPNTTVPVELTAYIDPTVVEILTAPRRAREVFAEEKKGTWVNSYAKWRTEEPTGNTTAYSDYANGVTSGVNEQWNVREQFIFQTTITYGDYELALSTEARINLAAAKQKAAANVVDIAANRYYLLGVENRDIYGILNDPNLPAATTPIAVPDGSGGSVTAWEDKSTKDIYNDILKLFSQLQSQSQGLISNDTPLKLLISPAMHPYLGVATDYNISVLDMLNKFFPALNIVTIPELSTESGETIFLIAPEVYGQRTGTLAFGEKLMAGRVIPDLSSFRQKYTASTYGGIVLMPFAFAQMTGIES